MSDSTGPESEVTDRPDDGFDSITAAPELQELADSSEDIIIEAEEKMKPEFISHVLRDIIASRLKLVGLSESGNKLIPGFNTKFRLRNQNLPITDRDQVFAEPELDFKAQEDGLLEFTIRKQPEPAAEDENDEPAVIQLRGVIGPDGFVDKFEQRDLRTGRSKTFPVTEPGTESEFEDDILETMLSVMDDADKYRVFGSISEA